jgi:hypothetical protein
MKSYKPLKTMLGSYLPLVICRIAHVLFTLFVFACVVVSNTYRVVLFCFSSSCVPYVSGFSGDFFIAPSVFCAMSDYEILQAFYLCRHAINR